MRRPVAGYDAGSELRLSAGERAALPVAMACQPLSSIGGRRGWMRRRQILTNLDRSRDALT